MRQAYWHYIENILTISKKIPSLKENLNYKRNSGPLLKICEKTQRVLPQGDTFSDASDKPKILNKQLSSVFTQVPTGSMPEKRPSSFPSVPQINNSTPCVQKLLDNLKPH